MPMSFCNASADCEDLPWVARCEGTWQCKSHVCTPSCIGEETAPALVVDESMSGQTVTAELGQIVEVRLEGNPTASYAWHLVASSKSLPVVESRFIPASSAAVGSGGVYSFTFKPDQLAAGGTHTARFALYRPWEGLQQAERTFVITIKVKKN